MLRSLLQTKSVDEIMAAADPSHGGGLRRSLGPWSITLLGIGAIIGTGIFTTVGTAAAGDTQRLGAGPSLMLSFVITAVVCGFTALCYAEFASSVPISGSAYTYSYATMGELVAWIIGWDLMIEYAIGNVAVAIGWAAHFRRVLEILGIHVPAWIATDYRSASILKSADPAEYARQFADAPVIFGQPVVLNLLAFLIVMFITVVLVWGVKESARFNAVMVIIKVLVLVFFVGVALYLVPTSTIAANWRPFQPRGWHGTLAGAAVVFFAYIGFDAVSTVAEETKNPGRDLPIGIFASLIICTVFYIVIAAAFTGMLPFADLRNLTPAEMAEPLPVALTRAAPNFRWTNLIVGIVAAGAVVAQTAVLLVYQMGQPRIFFSMARDGLLPPVFAKIHPRFKTPYVTTIMTGLLVGGVATFASIDEMVDLTNIGTLFAFILVCIGIPILRYTDPGRVRPFRVPLGPYFLPTLGAGSCLFLMYYLPPSSWWRFVGWLVLGLAVYFSYGYVHSTIGAKLGRPKRAPLALRLSATGFLLAAVGLFVVPHKSGPIRLVSAAFSAGDEEHMRSAIGLVMLALGISCGVAGMVRVASRGRSAEELV